MTITFSLQIDNDNAERINFIKIFTYKMHSLMLHCH